MTKKLCNLLLYFYNPSTDILYLLNYLEIFNIIYILCFLSFILLSQYESCTMVLQIDLTCQRPAQKYNLILIHLYHIYIYIYISNVDGLSYNWPVYRIILRSIQYVCLNNNFQFFQKYVQIKKCMKIRVLLLKN